MSERGVVKRIPIDRDTGARRGFFFIKPDGADSDEGVFAHASDLRKDTTPFAELREGDRVEYELANGEKGPRAGRVRVI